MILRRTDEMFIEIIQLKAGRAENLNRTISCQEQSLTGQRWIKSGITTSMKDSSVGDTRHLMLVVSAGTGIS